MSATDNSKAAQPIFCQPGLPVFQNMVYATREAALAAVTGDVELVQSPETGLVYNRRFDPALVEYGEDYQNEQGLSPAFQRHLAEVLALVLRHFGPHRRGVEVGCGKGFFLEMMAASGMQVAGYDAAYQGTNPAVHKRYYDPSVERNSPDFLVLRHVLEHIREPWSFLEMLANGSQAEVLIYIEVPCFQWIVSNKAFFDIFYEHCNYFSKDVLGGAFGDVIDSGHFFGGQYMYVVGRLATFRRPSFAGTPIGPLDFSDYKASVLARLLPHRKTFVWGAGAKGVTFANLLAADGTPVQGLIDINPAKQGKYIGLSGLQVLPPSALMALGESVNVIVMNPLYIAEIRKSLVGLDINFVTTGEP